MSMRKPSRDRRQDIQGATLELAFEIGPDRVTTGMIADRLGLSQPAIYKHFPTKEDLWRSINDLLATQITQNIHKATARAPDPVERLRRLVLGHLQMVQTTPALPAIMVARPQQGAHVVQSGLRASMVRFTDALHETICEAQAQGQFRNDIDGRDIATLVLGVIQSLVLRLLITHDTAVLLKDTDRLLALQLTTFRPQRETQ